MHDQEIFRKVFSYTPEERTYTVNTKYCVNANDPALMPYLFSSLTPPIQPNLCFWQQQPTETAAIYSYTLHRIYNAQGMTPFEICPFGNFERARVGDEYNSTVPFTCLVDNNIVQAYGLTRSGLEREVTNKVSNPTAEFKENLNNIEVSWDCGHMQDVADTFPAPNKQLSAYAKRENLSPQPEYWNRQQRSHLVKRIRNNGGGYYATFPTYLFHHLHQREIANGKWVPDGEFVQYSSFNRAIRRKQLFIPYLIFTSPQMSLKFNLGRSVADFAENNAATRIDYAIKTFEAGPSSIPKSIQVDLEDTPVVKNFAIDVGKTLEQHQADYRALSTSFQTCHNAAVKEYKSPHNKINLAILAQQLQNEQLIWQAKSAVKIHSKTLLDRCEAEERGPLMFRKYKYFTEHFPEATQTIDCLKRLAKVHTL